MQGSWELVCVGFAALSLMLGGSVVGRAADSASGVLQVGAERFALKCAFAVMEQDESATGDKQTLRLLLSDLPVPDDLRKASRDWIYWADKQARAGALRGVVLNIDPATGIWSGGQLLTRQGAEFYSETVSSPELSDLQFAPAGPIADQVAGKVSMKKPMSGAHDETGAWRVEAEFQATVIRPAAVSGVLTGAAALNSPQYKAVLAFMDACKKKNLEAIINSVDPKSRESMAEMFKANQAEALNMFAGMAAEAAAMKLNKVTVRGDSAEIAFGDGKPDSEPKQSLRVVLAKGEWKIAQ
ncbi:MAG: hypothetical protein ACLQKA_12630 [Bryobacteraceae bacterium]